MLIIMAKGINLYIYCKDVQNINESKINAFRKLHLWQQIPNIWEFPTGNTNIRLELPHFIRPHTMLLSLILFFAQIPML